MSSLELNHEQQGVLKEYLERVLSDLSVEIAGTDRKEYRDEIKAERRLLEEVMEQLNRAPS